MDNLDPIEVHRIAGVLPAGWTDRARGCWRAAAIQVSSGTDIDANLETCAGYIAEAATGGALLAALPENFSFLGEEEEKLARMEEIAQRSETFLLEQARRHDLLVLGGGYAVPHPSGRAWNRAMLAGPGAEGELARYDKIHLFDVDLPDRAYRESGGTEPGRDAVVWQSALGSFGFSICYDLRFPELYRALAAAGADILLVPAAFTALTGSAHWEILLRARAIENTSYVIAPAQCGRHSVGRHSHGHSLIVDPWGGVLADAGDEPGVVFGNIDPQETAEVRGRIPSLRHRRC